MYRYSERSKKKLATCAASLQTVFNKVILQVDCTILEGHRGEARQNEMFRTGKSKLNWPDSLHNSQPARAVDAVVYPIDWNDWRRMTLFAGFVLGLATESGVGLIWGGDWDCDFKVSDQTFHDLPHFQLRSW